MKTAVSSLRHIIPAKTIYFFGALVNKCRKISFKEKKLYLCGG